MKKKSPEGNPLKTVCIAGLVLTLILSWSMLISALLWGNRERVVVQGSKFSRNLAEYDLFDAPKRVMEGENPAQIERMLSGLQKQVKGIEEQLSVLKRRRALAQIDRRYIPAYEKAAREAAETFVHSVPIAVVAAEAVILGNTQEGLSLLKTYAARITQNRFDSLNLGLNILAGDMDNPARAAALPPELLAMDFPGISDKTRRALAIDDFLMKAYRRDIPGATEKFNALLRDNDQNSTEIIRIGAEFFYDHNNPYRAAEFFINLAGERDFARAADAWVLSGDIPAARNIWLALSTDLRSLYNLAATSADRIEEESWLEKLLSLRYQQNRRADDSIGIFSIIRYSRLLDKSRGLALLEEVKGNPLLDLELYRRTLDSWPARRAAAELWLLLGRHDKNEPLYEWAAWYFEQQKLYAESDRLLKEAHRGGMDGAWLDLHQSFAFIREGKTADGERVLREALISPGAAKLDWRIPANLGRIQENRRALSSALEYYETAAELLAMNRSKEKPAAAQVQMRMSRCLEALGRFSESQRALEFAYELDPDNINIRQAYRATQRR